MQTGEIILTMAGVAIVTAALALYSSRQKKAAWSGQVVNTERYQDADENDNYVLHIRTDEGKLMKVRMNAYQFGQFRTGDRILKRAGDPSPVKAMDPTANYVVLPVFCAKCGTAIAGTVNFCPACGASLKAAPRVPRVCMQCGNEALPGESFCVKCGKKIPLNP